MTSNARCACLSRGCFPVILHPWLTHFLGPALVLSCSAQDNYEIQVYGSETVAPKTTMVELHSNFTFQGSKETVDGVLPTEHALHETVEITQGLTSWSEVGFYIFTWPATARAGSGWATTSARACGRRRAGTGRWARVSPSSSGISRRNFPRQPGTSRFAPSSTNRRAGSTGRSIPRSIAASSGCPATSNGTSRPTRRSRGTSLRRLRLDWSITGDGGRSSNLYPFTVQSQQFVPAFDLNVSPKWEINFGVGVGVTAGTDHMLVKAIIGQSLRLGKPT